MNKQEFESLKKGDIVVCNIENSLGYTYESEYEVYYINADSDAIMCKDDEGDENGMDYEYFDLKNKQSEYNDNVNNPSHYTSGEIECIDAIESSMTPEAFKGYLKGCIQKYMWRYEKKANPVEDLNKAKWYLDKLISKQ